MKILHVAESLPGGIASYFEEILPHQSRRYGSLNVGLLAPESHIKGAKLFFDGERFGYKYSGRGFFSLFFLFWGFLRACFIFKPDVVHIHSTVAGVVVRFALLLFFFKRPRLIVYCPHGWLFNREPSTFFLRLVAFIERFLLLMTDIVICISEHDRKTALSRGFDGSKLVVVLNGISFDYDIQAPEVDFFISAEDRLKLLFVGRFDRQKGLDVFLRAVERFPDSVFGVVIGDFVVGGEEVNFPKNCVNAGWLSRAHISYFMQRADVLVVPSRWEGFGLVAIEAMRVGCPVIASKVGGLSEIVIDNVTGCFFDMNNVDDLGEKIKLFFDKSFRNSLSGAASERFSAIYDARRMNKSIDDIYNGARSTK